MFNKRNELQLWVNLTNRDFFLPSSGFFNATFPSGHTFLIPAQVLTLHEASAEYLQTETNDSSLVH